MTLAAADGCQASCCSVEAHRELVKVRLEPTPRWSRGLTAPLVVLSIWVGLLIAALCLEAVLQREIALCWFRRVTGIACPTCGGTRSAVALFHGDWTAAVAWNPLLFAAGVWVLAWGVLRFGCGRRLAVELHPWQRRLVWSVLGIAFAANWAYLIGRAT